MRLVLALCALLAAAPAGAQVITLPQRSREPVGWFSLNLGYHEQQAVLDGTTGTVWNFSSGLVYRAALEQARDRGSSVGLTATYARLPMAHAYDAACTSANEVCNAHGDVWQGLATFRIGGGEGFHQVIEFGVGAIHFRNFTDDETGTRLAPVDGDTDIVFIVSYGFGWGLSPRTHLMLVQDFGTSIHQGEGLQGGDRRMAQQRTTRVGFRYGLGQRAVRR